MTSLLSAAACVSVCVCICALTLRASNHKTTHPRREQMRRKPPVSEPKRNCVFKGFDSAKAASSRLEKLRLRIFMYPQMVSDLKSRGGERCLWFGTSPKFCEHNRSLLGLVIKNQLQTLEDRFSLVAH